jgi:putative restriction endonuclease
MDKQGFIRFNMMYSAQGSGKADSYARAIRILEEVLLHQNVVNLHCRSLYEISDVHTIDALLKLIKIEVAKLRRNEPNIFDYGNSSQKSYPLKNFCSSALRSLKEYALFERDVMKPADGIVAQEHDARTISHRLINYFDSNREGEDIEAKTKRRNGQEYFRRMLLKNYDGRCALTGIDIPQLLVASHIIPWKDKSHKAQRLNPCNGICLSILYDKAFDQGLIGFDSNYRTVLSVCITENEGKDYYDKYFAPIAGRELTMPAEYQPDKKFLEWHMDEVFLR